MYYIQKYDWWYETPGKHFLKAIFKKLDIVMKAQTQQNPNMLPCSFLDANYNMAFIFGYRRASDWCNKQGFSKNDYLNSEN